MRIVDKRKYKLDIAEMILLKNDKIYMFAYDGDSEYPYHLIDVNTGFIINSWDEIPTVKEFEMEYCDIIDVISVQNAKMTISRF